MNKRIWSMAFLSAGLLVACSNNEAEEVSETATVEKSTADMDVKELVTAYSTKTKEAESASITSDELIVKEADGKEQVYDLPEDEFFVSIAPYINETHP